MAYIVQQKDFMGIWHSVFMAQRSASAYHYFKGLEEAHGKGIHRILETF